MWRPGLVNNPEWTIHAPPDGNNFISQLQTCYTSVRHLDSNENSLIKKLMTTLDIICTKK